MLVSRPSAWFVCEIQCVENVRASRCEECRDHAVVSPVQLRTGGAVVMLHLVPGEASCQVSVWSGDCVQIEAEMYNAEQAAPSPSTSSSGTLLGQ